MSLCRENDHHNFSPFNISAMLTFSCDHYGTNYPESRWKSPGQAAIYKELNMVFSLCRF